MIISRINIGFENGASRFLPSVVPHLYFRRRVFSAAVVIDSRNETRLLTGTFVRSWLSSSRKSKYTRSIPSFPNTSPLVGFNTALLDPASKPHHIIPTKYICIYVYIVYILN